LSRLCPVERSFDYFGRCLGVETRSLCRIRALLLLFRTPRAALITALASFFTLFNAVCAASQNIQSVIIFRFLAGAFGEITVNNVSLTL
jgi:hypothetical protein